MLKDIINWLHTHTQISKTDLKTGKQYRMKNYLKNIPV